MKNIISKITDKILGMDKVYRFWDEIKEFKKNNPGKWQQFTYVKNDKFHIDYIIDAHDRVILQRAKGTYTFNTLEEVKEFYDKNKNESEWNYL